jgi:hypothetical protein
VRPDASSMNELPAPVVGPVDGGTAVVALIGWKDDRGAAGALLQALIESDRTRVFLAELRDWPERNLAGDVEAATAIVWQTLAGALRQPVEPGDVEWYLRHGQFSTYDLAGPETLTRVELTWQSDRWRRARGWESFELVDYTSMHAVLEGIDDVDDALEQVVRSA